MTRQVLLELAAALRPRYHQASNAQQKVILDEFCATTAYHHKATMRLLNHAPQAASPTRRGRPRHYLPQEVLAPLLLAWQAAATSVPSAWPLSWGTCSPVCVAMARCSWKSGSTSSCAP